MRDELNELIKPLQERGFSEDSEAFNQQTLKIILCFCAFAFLGIPAVCVVARQLGEGYASLPLVGSFLLLYVGLSRRPRSRHTGKPMKVLTKTVPVKMHGVTVRYRCVAVFICDQSKTYFTNYREEG